jgi:hypothetical protein
MLSDDAIRSRLQATVESLRYWVPTIADVADTSEREGLDGWTLVISPRVAGACPVQVTLHPAQRFDLVIAGESYEGRTAASFDLILPLLEAITEGRIVQRHWISTATGAVRAIETIVRLADGSVWRDGRTIEPVATIIPREATERHDRHFVPYRR